MLFLNLKLKIAGAKVTFAALVRLVKMDNYSNNRLVGYIGMFTATFGDHIKREKPCTNREDIKMRIVIWSAM